MHLRKKNWDIDDIMSQIHSIKRECESPYNDGFTSWGFKQDLLRLQILINDIVKNSPKFGNLETEWLKLQEQKHIIKLLKD